MFDPLGVSLGIISPSSCCMDTGRLTTSLSVPFFCLFIASAICCEFVSRLLHCFTFCAVTFLQLFSKTLAGVKTDSLSNEKYNDHGCFTSLELLSRNLSPYRFTYFYSFLISLIIFPFFLVRLLTQIRFLSFLIWFAPSLSSLPQIRYRKDRVRSKLTPTFPLVYAVKDLSNGCAIASVLYYYCSGMLALEGTAPAHKDAWAQTTRISFATLNVSLQKIFTSFGTAHFDRR